MARRIVITVHGLAQAQAPLTKKDEVMEAEKGWNLEATKLCPQAFHLAPAWFDLTLPVRHHPC